MVPVGCRWLPCVFFLTHRMKARISHVSAAGCSKPHKKRFSRRTSCSAGTALVIPAYVLLSRRDVASAFAAVQFSRLRHLRNHALRTSSRTFCGADSALDFDSAPLNFSTQHDEACAPSLPHQLREGSLRLPPSVIQFWTAPLWSAALLRVVPSRCTKGTPWWCRWQIERRRRWSDHRQRSPIAWHQRVLDLDIRGHTTTSFSAHLCSCPLQCKFPSHRQVREEKGRGSWRRRHNNTQKGPS